MLCSQVGKVLNKTGIYMMQRKTLPVLQRKLDLLLGCNPSSVRLTCSRKKTHTQDEWRHAALQLNDLGPCQPLPGHSLHPPPLVTCIGAVVIIF